MGRLRVFSYWSTSTTLNYLSEVDKSTRSIECLEYEKSPNDESRSDKLQSRLSKEVLDVHGS